MAFTEKPPILRGTEQEQLNALRDYLFRMAQSLSDVASADSSIAVSAGVRKDGTRVYETTNPNKAIEDVRRNAQELRALIIKSADQVVAYTDRKLEEFSGLYVAESEFGTFTETLSATIEQTARGVVESYDYESSIESFNDSIDLLQNYFSAVNGEIRRGIVIDPDTGNYVTGIAISQNLQFSGECGPSDAHNPGDGYTYYYLNTGQTFGLYTSTGWQFWIDGHKKGWFSSQDGMLHVSQIVVETLLQIGTSWQFTAETDGSEFELKYIGS